RQIVKRLQHQHPKHHHDVDRLAAGGTLLLAHRRQHRRLDLRTEALERHHASNHFQRIALRGNRRKPPVRIQKSELPHRPHTPNLVATTQIRTNSRRSLFFEVPYSQTQSHLPRHCCSVENGSIPASACLPQPELRRTEKVRHVTEGRICFCLYEP